MKKRFKKVYIETTNICNLSCNFCPKTSRKMKMMSVDEFETIIQKVKQYTNHVYFHIMGEPLLNENLPNFFEICKRENLHVNLTTNGTLIKKNSRMLLAAQSLRQINISLHSYEANEQEKELIDYLDDILDFITEVQNQTNILISLRLWNMDTTDLKGANTLNYHILKRIEEKFRLTDSIMEQLIEVKQLKISKQVYLNMAEKFQWPDMNQQDIEHQVFCYGLRNQIGILADGTVVPCCLDSEGTIALGNLFSQSMEEILHSERAQAIYNGFTHRKAVEELCKHCDYAKRF